MSLSDREAIIEVNDVYKNFRVYFDKGSMLKEHFVTPGRSRYEEREILKGISFNVFRGETIALIGQNGCGKSTTLKMLTKILYPNKGSVTVKGKVSSLIELGAGFHPDMSGRENIYINASILGIKREEVDKRIDEIIRFSELEEFIDNPIRTYSSGMYMRLAFSVAINVDADILLIDEILAVGDQAFQEKCIRKLDELREAGITIVLVSHSMGQIREIADRCIWIENGRIREDGSTEDVCAHYEEAMTRKREERDELEEEQRQEDAECRENVGLEALDSGSDADNVIETKRKQRKILRERQLQEIRKRQEAFSAKWQGGGIQGRSITFVSMVVLMVLLSASADVFVIGWNEIPEGVISIANRNIIIKVFGYILFVIGRVSIPMILILLGFELLKKDYSSKTKRFNYYLKTFLPMLAIWEIWVLFYQMFLLVFDGRKFDFIVWMKEAFLIKYIDVGCLWIFRFIFFFMLIAPYVALALQLFSVGSLRFIMLIIWMLFFLFPGLDYYGQANGGESSFPQSLGTFCYFFYFCLGFLISRYMQRIFKGSKEVMFFSFAFALTVWSQIFFDDRGVRYLIKPTFFGVSLMALFGVDLLLRFRINDMYRRIGSFFDKVGRCVLGVVFVYGPIQLILTRYVFKLGAVHEGGSAIRLAVCCLGLWICTVIVSFGVVYVFFLFKQVCNGKLNCRTFSKSSRFTMKEDTEDL